MIKAKPITLYTFLDANDCCCSDRMCEQCIKDSIEYVPLKESERVTYSGKGLCCNCGEGGEE